ncbi:hypothetical protein TNCV_2585371 [Trichonephila clavipes]|nr:hypothetical protein TNCV_2585371 [Trichonephila clavipes]
MFHFYASTTIIFIEIGDEEGGGGIPLRSKLETLLLRRIGTGTNYDFSEWRGFAVVHILEDSAFCDAALRVAEAMVSKMRVHAAANVMELFVQALVVLQSYPILNSGLVTWLHDPLRSCG